MDGWIKIHRQITHHAFWDDEFSRGQAWIDLLLLAAHKPSSVRKRGVLVSIARGQVGVSIKGLAARWKWSQGKVKRFLYELKSGDQIEYQITNVTTVITITNYDTYQSDGEQNGEQTETKRRPDGEQTETIKNEKKGKNVKKFIVPTVQDVTAYCTERKSPIDPQQFVDYYTANGWKVGKNPMRDWRAAVRTWEKNSFTDSSPDPASKGRGDAMSKIDVVREGIRCKLWKAGIRDEDEIQRRTTAELSARGLVS